ncbi:hypothetical protein ABT104_05880 [Streptomyces mobaraensis]|uniref:hypothetical protein n=1 Tax=Streptomyces mobaraensis TaxID=35621 RepID=UPI00331FCF1F
MTALPESRPDPTVVPSALELAKTLKALGGTPRRYLPDGANETLSKAALATAVHARAAKVAYKAKADLVADGATMQLPVLNRLHVHAVEEGDDRPEALALVWYGRASDIAVDLRTIRDELPDTDPLIKAAADTARALMILLEARLNLSPDHLDRLTTVLAEAEEMLTSARSHTSRIPNWLRTHLR